MDKIMEKVLLSQNKRTENKWKLFLFYNKRIYFPNFKVNPILILRFFLMSTCCSRPRFDGLGLKKFSESRSWSRSPRLNLRLSLIVRPRARLS